MYVVELPVVVNCREKESGAKRFFNGNYIVGKSESYAGLHVNRWMEHSNRRMFGCLWSALFSHFSWTDPNDRQDFVQFLSFCKCCCKSIYVILRN